MIKMLDKEPAWRLACTNPADVMNVGGVARLKLYEN